jgi:hypothetical protein
MCLKQVHGQSGRGIQETCADKNGVGIFGDMEDTGLVRKNGSFKAHIGNKMAKV